MEKYYFQLKSYFISNLKLLKYFKNDNELEAKNDWSEDLFRAINRNWIKQWKSYIGFDSICQELKNKNINEIKDDCKDWITSLIEDNIKKNKKLIKKLDNSSIYDSYDSLFSSEVKSLNNSSNINNSSLQNSSNLEFQEILNSRSVFGSNSVVCESNFDLISKEAWELFDDEKNNEKNNYDGKISIKIGKNKIIIKFKQDLYIVQYPNPKHKEINDLEKDLIQLKIRVSRGKPDKFIKAIINKFPPIDYMKEIKNYCIGDKIFLFITKKEIENTEPFLSDLSSIKEEKNYYDNESINKENKNLKDIIHKSLEKNNININLKDVNYINTIIVRKLHNTTYIIASIYSLSQIKEFAEYFFINEKNKKRDIKYSILLSDLLSYFKDYINQLWIDKNENYIFYPKKFMKSLNKYNKNIFDFKDEKEPIIFLKEIFNYINKELNNKDEEIKVDILKSFDELLGGSLYFSNFMKEFINNYNSIVSKIFYGIIIQQYTCETCKAKGQKYEILDYLELNYNNYYKYKNGLNNSIIDTSNNQTINESFINFNLDDLIDFYFEPQNVENINICKCDKSKIKNEKKIYKFPKTLIIYINWGKFSKDEGFGFDSNKLILNEEIDLTKYNFNINNINKIKYNIRSVIYYPVLNIKNKKFITICRHLIDQKLYFYIPSRKVDSEERINRIDLIPSIIFFEKEEYD